MRLNTSQTLALNLDSHIVIDAGAGTGKTSTIIERVIEHYLTEDQRATRILPVPERPADLSGGMLSATPSERVDLRDWGGLLPGEVVLITFTNRASDEIKDRLRKKILSLRYGSMGIGDEIQTDPRIRDPGFVEQLLTLLDDAPIGTIDSFLNRLTSPYKWKLDNSLSRGNISDTGRILITEQAMKTIWRLSSAPSRIGDAVDAGIPGNIATQVIEARDRLSVLYPNHWYAKKVLSSLVANSVFLDEASRKIMDENGMVDPALIRTMLLEEIEEEIIHEHARNTHHLIGMICELIKENLNHLEIKKGRGWGADTRVACLNSLNESGPPKDTWKALVWLSQIFNCIVTQASLFEKKGMTFFPHDHFPVDSWEAGVNRPSQISDKSLKKEYQDKFREIKDGLIQLWNGPQNSFLLHFVRTSIFLSDSRPHQAPEDWIRSSEPLPVPIPVRLDSDPSGFHYSMDAEVSNLQDLYLLKLGFKGIIDKIKETEESHDFDDIQRFAGDLLLANCPEACRSFYPDSVQKALDSLDKDQEWRDDHIHSALRIISEIESSQEKTHEYYTGITAVRRDLEERLSILKSIRRRYRAFIIDEAQDNSPLQWRILSRLWGEREIDDGEKPPPETPWQPTICYVGDVKQSIYAFRQAEVSGFRKFANTLMSINDHEFTTVRELTRKPALRRESESRNPRNSSALTITKGTEYSKDAGRHLAKWIPFDAPEIGNISTPVHANEVKNRKRGLITLSVNYRTSGGMIRAMNEWWEDIFSSKYNDIPGADYYASSQALSPCDEKFHSRGSIEWICPVNSEIEGNPSTDLDEPIDPFGSSKRDQLERQALLIALRIKSLIDGSPPRVISERGWKNLDSEDPIEPNDIMILLPTRPRIREAIVRQLRNLEIPVQLDQEGGLLERPIVHALNGLLQLVANPTSIHYATWVSRSPIIGMNDENIQNFSREAEEGEDLLQKLAKFSTNSRQKSLIERWCSLSKQSRIIDILEETLEFSDLLTSYHEDSSRQEADQFVEVVREISSEAGGDPIVIADSIREIMESNPEKMESKNIPAGNSVRMMTIHSAKGLEAKVVIIADLFSKRQTNMSNDHLNRLIVTPEIFAGKPNPWPSQGAPYSAIWSHAAMLHKSRKIAEARRLLYVGATRAEEKLILVGSSGATHTESVSNVLSTRIPWITGKDNYYEDKPQLGQMWLRSLAMGSVRRSEENSPWIPPHEESNEVLLEPGNLIENAFLGSSNELGMAIFHHPNCFPDTEWEKQVTTIKNKIKNIAAISSSGSNESQRSNIRKDASVRVRVSPSNLTDFQDCSRRHWLETRGGMKPQAISESTEVIKIDGEQNKFNKAVFGTIFHRIVEIGIGNPGAGKDGPSTPLLNSWTTRRPNLIHEEEIHDIVFQEYLPPGSNKEKIARLAKIMASRINSGVLGQMISGHTIDGHTLEGLRTEYPFNISLPLDTEGIVQTRWTPDGNQQLSISETPIVETSGIIDLILCTKTVEGESTIRAVDLKTEEAERIEDQKYTGLLESIGSQTLSPVCYSEEEILNKHRMQLALYHKALKETEQSKKNLGLPYRKVLPPAILIGVTGRIVEFPKEMMEKSLTELDELLERSVIMATKEELSISDFPRLTQKESKICESCPFNRGDMPFCGPNSD